jgi:hypothetical protein
VNVTHHLFRSHAHRFNRKLATAHVKQVFKIGPKEVNSENIVQAFLAKVMHLGDAN